MSSDLRTGSQFKTASQEIPVDFTKDKGSKELPFVKPSISSNKPSPLLKGLKVIKGKSKTSKVAVPVVEAKKVGLKDRFIQAFGNAVVGFVNNDPNNLSLKKENAKQIVKEITGDPKIIAVLELVSSKLCPFALEKIQEVMQENDIGEGLKGVLKDQQNLLSNIIEASFFKMMANLAQGTQKDLKNKQTKVAFTDMLSNLLKTLEKHIEPIEEKLGHVESISDEKEREKQLELLEPIEEKLGDVESISDEKEREKQLELLIEPFRKDLFQLLLPNGVDDIITPDGFIMNTGKGKIFSLIEKALPSLFLDLYHDLMDPYNQVDEIEEELNVFIGGDVLVDLADTLGEIFSDNAPETISNSASLIRNLFKDNPEVAEWIGNELALLTSSEDLNNLWNFSGDYLAAILKQVFLNLAEYSQAEDPKNILNAISKNLTKTFVSFFSKNNSKIDVQLGQLKECITDEEQTLIKERIYGLLEPLKRDVKKMLGINRLILPDLLKEQIDKAFEDQFLERILQAYQAMKTIQDTPDLQQKENAYFVELAGSVVSTILPNMLTKLETKGPSLFIELVNVEPEAVVEKNQLVQNMLTELIQTQIPKNYVETQLKNVLAKILIKINASRNPLNVEDKEGFLNYVVYQVIKLIKENNQNLSPEILKEISELKKLSDEDRKIAKERLVKHFEPFAKSLLNFVGFNSAALLPGPDEFKETIYDNLKETILPRFLLDSFEGLVTSEIEFDNEPQLQPAQISKLKTAVEGLSSFIVDKGRNYLTDSSEDLVHKIDDALNNNLSSELQDWLEGEFEKLGQKKSPLFIEGETFLKGYFSKIMFGILVHLTQGYNVRHHINPLDEDIDVFKNAALELISVFNRSFTDAQNTLSAQLNNYFKLSEVEQRLKEEDLFKEIEPIVKNLLSKIGFSAKNDLPVPEYMQEILWSSLKGTLIPKFLFSLIKDVYAFSPDYVYDTNGISNIDTMKEMMVEIGQSLVPVAQKKMKDKEKVIQDFVFNLIDKQIPGVVQKITVESLVREFIDPQEREVKKLFDLVPRILTNFITPILVNIAASEKEEGDVLFCLVENLSHLIQDHFEDKQEVLELAFTNYANLGKEEKQELLKEHFAPFLDELLDRSGIKAEFLTDFIRSELLEKSYEIYSNAIKPLLLQKQARADLYAINGITAKNLIDHPQIESPIEAIENIIDLASEKLNDQVVKYIEDNLESFMTLFESSFGINTKNTTWLQESLHGLLGSQEDGFLAIKSYATQMTKAVLLNLIVKVAKNLPNSDGKIGKDLIPEILQKVALVLENNLDGVEEKIKKIKKAVKDPLEREKEITKLFIPLADGIINMAGEDPLEGLPIPDSFKKTVLEVLKNELLPSFIGKVYADVNLWKAKSESDKDTLNRIFNKNTPVAAAKVISRFVSDFIPALGINPKNQVAQKITTVLTDYMLKQNGNNVDAINDYLEKNKSEIINLLQDNLNQVLNNPNNTAIDTFLIPALEAQIEAGVLKFMANLFTKIQSKEGHLEPGDRNLFLVNMGLKLIKVADSHFSEIVSIMKSQNKKQASDVDFHVMLENFSPDVRHAAFDDLAKDKDLAPAVQQEKMMEHFFIPMTEEFLELANIKSSKDLPVPDAMRDVVYDLLKKQLGPLLMQQIMGAVNIDKMMLNVLKEVNEAEKSSKTTEKTPLKDNNEDLATQIEITESCGRLFMNFIQLVPNKAIKLFFSEEKIRQLSAESIGKIVIEQLQSLSFVKLINEGLSAGIVNLSDQITLDDDGNLIVPENLHFAFGTTEEDNVKDDVALKKESEMVKDQLIKELTNVLGFQIRSRIRMFFSGPWKIFQSKMDAIILDKLGEKAMRVKSVLDKFFRMVLINVALALLTVLLIPFRFILRRHLKEKASQITDTLHMGIHKNLIFNMAEAFVQELKTAPTRTGT